jgi:TonB family protein
MPLRSPESARPLITGAVVAAAIYLAGVVLLLLHAAVGWLTSRRLRLSAQRVTDAGALERLDRHSAAAGMAHRPQLVESARLFVPLTMSVRRPIVALPADWRDWPADRLEAVLAHEVAHVARRDALTQRLSLFYRAILWCSPLSWWLHRHLSDLAEQASDEAALHAGINPTSYAETLLDFFVRLQGVPRRAEWHVAMARRADAAAARRVERILSWEGSSMLMLKRSRVFVLGLVLATAPVLALTASVRPAHDAAQPLPPSTSFATPARALEGAAAPLPGIATPATERPGVSVSAPAAVRRQNPPSQKPTGPAQKPPQGQAVPAQSDDDFAKGAYEVDAPGVLAPVALVKQMPRYTPDAMRAKLQGAVHVEIIIMPDGTVGKARIKESLDPVTGLDEQALIAARAWTFVPGTLRGEAVPIYVVIVLDFKLH